MPNEDPNIGTSPDVPAAPETPTVTTETPTVDTSTDVVEVPHDNTPINPVKDALDAFERELGRKSDEAPVVPAPVKLARKFDGLEEPEVKMFKNMSNEAYNYLYPLLLEHKKLKPSYEDTQKKLEEARAVHFFEQEGAWKLTPQYSELSQHAQRLSAETAHWKQQLIAAEAGEQVRMLYQDPETNKIYLGDPEDVTPAHKSEIISALQRASTLQAKYSSDLASFEQGFKQKHTGYISRLKDLRAQVFQGADMEKLTKAAKTKLSMFPDYMQGRLETQLLAESLVLIDGLTSMIRNLQSGKRTTDIKAKTATNSGPTAQSAQSGAAGTGKKVSNIIDEWKQARALGVA